MVCSEHLSTTTAMTLPMFRFNSAKSSNPLGTGKGALIGQQTFKQVIIHCHEGHFMEWSEHGISFTMLSMIC